MSGFILVTKYPVPRDREYITPMIRRHQFATVMWTIYKGFIEDSLKKMQSLYTEQILFELQRCECEYSEDGVDYSDFAGCLIRARKGMPDYLLFSARYCGYLELKGKFCDYFIPDIIREAIFIALIFSLVCRGKIRLDFVLDGQFAKIAEFRDSRVAVEAPPNSRVAVEPKANSENPIVEFYQFLPADLSLQDAAKYAARFRHVFGINCDCRILIVW
ncbi:MAG: hypothetical protein M0R33_13870 [Methylomonas sp.]|jgi:hypothetical protein|uniref:hypothetical protein n=1 Tax=Methylomonas sp. TaxID=418 RepID=UPI0025D2D4F6|nr:hypothetical protein [Methylomonas sp.]MCK9607523.1 hypothetical protein [Methylomonas sp.]